MKLKEIKRFINNKDKIPFVNGKHLKWNDVTVYLTYEEALKNAKTQNLGISIVLGDINDEYYLAGIDYDSVCDKNGNIDSEIKKDLKLFKHNHKSKSGYGFHTLCLVKKDIVIEKNRVKINTDVNLDRKDENGKTKIPEIEFYLNKRTFDVPLDLDITKDDIVDSSGEFKYVYNKYMNQKGQKNRNSQKNYDESRKDYALMCEYLKKGYSKDEAKELFIKSEYVKNKDLKHKEKLERKDYLDRTLNNCEKNIIGEAGNSNLKVNEILNMLNKYNLFTDERNVPYIIIDNKNININSKLFEEYLEGICYKNKINLSSLMINKIKNILSYTAREENKSIRLDLRFSGDKDNIYYQLDEQKVVHISKNMEGYEIIENNTPRFRWFSNMKSQVLPIENNDVKLSEMFELFNIPEEERLIFLIYLISLFIPNIPKPILIISAEKGSGKTMLTKFIKDLADPSILSSTSLSNDVRALIQLLDHSAVINFDNLQKLSNTQSDILCRAYSGDAIMSRQLYSNDEEFIVEYKRAIILNGIDCPAYKSDLLDRSILIDLERIDSKKRKSEIELYKIWNEKKAFYLDLIFKVLSRSLQYYDTIEIEEMERFADWQKWGIAIASTFGQEYVEKFKVEVKKIISKQDFEVIENNAIAREILKFMEDKTEWSGTPTELLGVLKSNVSIEDLKYFSTSSALTRKIRAESSLFKNNNLNIEILNCSKNKREIIIKKIK